MSKRLTKAQAYVLTALCKENAKVNNRGMQPAFLLPNGMSVLFRKGTFSTLLTLKLIMAGSDGYYYVTDYGRKVYFNNFNLKTLKLSDMKHKLKKTTDGIEAYVDGVHVGTYSSEIAAMDGIDAAKRRKLHKGDF